MSKFLQQLLDAQEPMFSRGLQLLEKSAGNSSIDVRLIADITESAHKIMRQLNLDTKDTTGPELYSALVASVKSGNAESLLMNADYVMITINGKVTSFNLIDVIENSHHRLPYSHQIVSHGRRSLRGELVTRYIDHARTDNITTLQIASSIGLLPNEDAWYNNSKYTKRQTDKISKEHVK